MLPIESAFKVFTDRNGKPLENGYVYFGLPNQNPITSPITVYWDVDGTQPAAQPLRTVSGYIMRSGTPANVFVGAAYSQLVQDHKGRQVFYARTSDDFSIATMVLAFIASLLATTGASMLGWIRNAVGATPTTVAKWMERKQHDVFDFMTDAEIADVQSMAPVLNHTAAILAYKAFALGKLPCTMVFPRGWYRYTDIGNFAYGGLSLKGYAHRETIMECTTAVPALMVDAFKPGLTANDATAPFIKQANYSDITFQGTAATAKIIDAQGIARSAWRNIFTRNGEPLAGIAIHMRGCMLSSFYNIGCSTDMDTMASKPYEGLRMDAGVRNAINVGNSSNNSFTNPYFEGLQINGRLSGADQNVFLSGAFESGGVYDLLVSGTSRYNTLIGVGFESTTVTANVSDAGYYTRYTNCYANKNMILQGAGARIDGGYYQRIETQAAANSCIVGPVTVGHWETSFPGTGGFFDSATTTRRGRIYNEVTASYSTQASDRTAIVVGASPFTWTNTSGQRVTVTAQTGTLSQVRQGRNGDFWLTRVTTPNSWDIEPGDLLEFSYSVIPVLSYLTNKEL